jgi:superfamily I DNA/RNA helicase
MPSPQQDRIIAHGRTHHGRVLAGPGTGKSTTVLQLAEKLADGQTKVQVITFTRAATAELLEKIRTEGHDVGEPVTVHSFALSLLLKNPGQSGLPEPLRIPDEWETRHLIHDDIARRLRGRGFTRKRGFSKDVSVKDVDRLEREMAAGWESLDEKEVLLAEIDPELRNLYLAIWQANRRVFGYSLFAEMPLYARNLLEDRRDAEYGAVEFLIVDEYQDLNRCEIALMEALAARGVRILSVGDDDQSIYSWRMAHPRGIREFASAFHGAKDYSLSVSFRCGREILAAARKVIESTPGRPSKPTLQESPSNPRGLFRYLRFWNQEEERSGITNLVTHLRSKHKLKPSEIVVLTRADYGGYWSTPLRDTLLAADIPATDVEAALEPLSESHSRKLLAIGRLAVQPSDDLAWWTLLKTTGGVSDEFIQSLADECAERQERFGARMLALEESPPAKVTAQSLRKALAAQTAVLGLVRGVKTKAAPRGSEGWGEWLLQAATSLKIPISGACQKLIGEVSKEVPADEGLGHFLNQLEPVAKDLAVKTPGVAIMTMGRSKGLTFRAAFVMGVEEGVIPFPKANDENEERRLLYVAMTRAREFVFLTMASRRDDNTGRSGAGFQRDRRRCPFFEVLDIRPIDGTEFLKRPACC